MSEDVLPLEVVSGTVRLISMKMVRFFADVGKNGCICGGIMVLLADRTMG